MDEQNNDFVDAKPTIEEVEAALKHFRQTPAPEGEDPFWHDQAERHLNNLLEMLKNEAPQ